MTRCHLSTEHCVRQLVISLQMLVKSLVNNGNTVEYISWFGTNLAELD